ncbi:MAG: alpha-glucosidase C-terminal domain-containing protein [Candidatus Levybacteria bacterium]|nr:alpha-glucosidase C-terminal domain-containing protein [Candidatus Levybacteria bacterium]
MKTNWHQSVIYHIYPRSFKDSNKDGIGDLNGIIQKLDYVVELGADTIWISPTYPSPMRDFGYDISDFCNVDPLFGTLEDFDNLIQEAHNRNIKVIIDYIPGHTAWEHPWFVASASSRINPKRDWYIWRDPKPDGSVPNNWLSVFGGSRWEYDARTGQYYMHSFLKEMPDLNWRNPEVVDAMLEVLRFWLKRGIDGIRIDSFNVIYKHMDYLDEPLNPAYIHGENDPFREHDHIYTLSQPELLPLLKTFRKVLSEFGDKFMVTESYVEMPQLLKLYRAGDSLHAPFNFNIFKLPWNLNEYKSFIDVFDKEVGHEYIPTYVLGNHDNHRIATKIGSNQARIAAMLQLTLRGMPTVYYGEEIGMIDGEISLDEMQDPWAKNVGDVRLGRDPQRTPMQWNTEKYAGFSTKKPWLPIGKQYMYSNVEIQQSDTQSMLNLYKTILHFRKQSPALLYGTYESLKIKNKNVYAYMRTYKTEKLLILLNFSEEEQKISLNIPTSQVICNSYLTKEKGSLMDLKNSTLAPFEGYILQLSQ